MPPYTEPRSLTGNSSALSVEAAHYGGDGPLRTAHDGRDREWCEPRAADAIEPGTCQYCGAVVDHADPFACIDQLRDAVATLTAKKLRLGRTRRRA